MILAGSLVLAILGSVTGILLHAYSALRNYKAEADRLIDYMMSLEDGEYIDRLFAETKEIYNNLPEDLRDFDVQLSDEYIAQFSPLVDDDYLAAKDIMTKCLTKTGQQNLWLIYTEPERGAVVYVIDADPSENAYMPGFWLEDSQDRIDAICDSSWRLDITQFDKDGYVGAAYKRLYSSDGKQIGYVQMDLELTGFVKSISRFLMVLIPAVILLVILIAMYSARVLKRFVITHISDLAAAAKDYAARDNTAIDEDTPSVFEPLALNTSDEIEDLWLSMTGMEADVRDSMIRLRDMTTESERIRAELDIAKEIQTGMLPDRFPEKDEFEMYAFMETAKEVGGDLYDFIMIDEDHLAVVVADVSGKGVSAALFMTVAKTLINDQSGQSGYDPAAIMNNVNAKLIEVNKTGMFVTAWLGILDLDTGEMAYADAGHEYPAICRKDGKFRLEQNDDVKGIPLAVSGRRKYTAGSVKLGKGDCIFLYTDGVTEANDKYGRLMGTGRLLEVLNKDAAADPKTLIKNVSDAVEAYSDGAPQFDDITMLCLRFKGKPTGEQ